MSNQDFDRRELQNCVYCKKGMMHSGAIHFYEVNVTQCLIDLESVRQQHGLEVMMGAASPLASIFAPSTRVAQRVGDGTRKLVCSDCIVKIIELIEE